MRRRRGSAAEIEEAKRVTTHKCADKKGFRELPWMTAEERSKETQRDIACWASRRLPQKSRRAVKELLDRASEWLAIVTRGSKRRFSSDLELCVIDLQRAGGSCGVDLA